MTSKIQMDEFISFANILADESSKVVMKYFRQNIKIENKDDNTPVTIADKKSEIIIRELINNAYPSHGILAEEFDDTKPNSEYIWVVDPIDGTRSFIAGHKDFGTLIALLYKKKPVLGIINCPAHNERWIGVENQITTLNGKKIKTSQKKSIEDCYTITTGLYFDDEGNLLAAADEKNELWRIATDKKVTVVIDNFEEKKLNGPNDIWVDQKEGIYFTDPFYKRSWWQHTEPEQSARRVYYLAANTSEPRVVIDDNYEQPNGIIGTPDGKTLYVSDNGAKKTYVYDISKNGDLKNKKLFADMGSDGMTVDHLGNVYLTGDGVTVFNKKGEQIKHIPVPENWTANVTFGGPKQNILFITAMDSVYTLEMNVHGVRY